MHKDCTYTLRKSADNPRIFQCPDLVHMHQHLPGHQHRLHLAVLLGLQAALLVRDVLHQVPLLLVAQLHADQLLCITAAWT